MFLIVGLGNYGEKYKNTRHNAGFIILDAILGKDGWEKSKSCNLHYRWDGEKLEYIKPQTMMNLSGQAVSCAVKKHEVSPENIIVIHDDVDLEFGKFKISYDSSDGGHKGIKSIINSLGTKKFTRIRVGIAPTSFFTKKKKKPASVERFVLGNFPKKKMETLKEMSVDIKEGIEMIMKGERIEAMNKFN